MIGDRQVTGVKYSVAYVGGVMLWSVTCEMVNVQSVTKLRNWNRHIYDWIDERGVLAFLFS